MTYWSYVNLEPKNFRSEKDNAGSSLHKQNLVVQHAVWPGPKAVFMQVLIGNTWKQKENWEKSDTI